MNNPDTRKLLEEAEKKGGWTAIRTYIRLSGPGWLQSAITLGGGSLSSALFLGVVGGYTMLWVQPLALAMGVIMLAAIGYVSLSIDESPFKGIRTHINPVLAWGWILATVAANLVWALPQFALAYAAFTENITQGAIAEASRQSWKIIISLVFLILVVWITLFYGKNSVGIKIYETILKIVVGVIVLSFVGVVLKLVLSDGGLPLGRILSGFIPNPSVVFHPSAASQTILDSIHNEDARAFWTEQVLSNQRDVIVAAASAAVGINMTFLLPFSMRAKGWGKVHRRLAIFDLSTGLAIPFILATSCIVIASGFLFHGQPFEGVLEESNGTLTITEDAAFAQQTKEVNDMLALRGKQAALQEAPLEDGELRAAAMLLRRNPGQFAKALEPLVGPVVAQVIFGIGALAMALSSISLLMLISGFTICEMFGYPHGGIHHKLGTLLPSFGVLWPFLWTGSSQSYLAVPTSVFGYVLLPIAFIAFLFMMNSKSLLGENRPKGRSRVTWNTLMGVSLLVTGAASVSTAWGRSMMVGATTVPVGKIFLIGFGIAMVLGHFYLRGKKKA